MRPIPLLSCLCLCVLVSLAAGDETSAPGPAPSPAPSASPAAVPAVKLLVELIDGSRVNGIPASTKFKLKTSYAEMDIELSKVRGMEFAGDAGHAAHLAFHNGDTLNGQLMAKEIVLNTVFGKAAIPLADVRAIRVSVPGQGQPDGLVLRFSFDSDEGDRVTDSSGFGNDGTVNGPAWTDAGKSGGGMSFNGDHQVVQVKNSHALQLQDFTIMAWVKRGANDRTSRTWMDGSIFGYGDQGYSLGIRNNGLPFLCKIGGGGNAVFATCEIKDDAWHHLVVVKDGSKVVFYLDGTAYPADEYGDKFDFNTDLGVGNRPDNLTSCFWGLIDEVEVYKRPLSENEVKDVYDSQK